jgi:hypothetical protein
MTEIENNSVDMGWGAAPIKQQHPALPDDIAAMFDEDNAAISRLLLRGLITQTAASSARTKYVNKVGNAIRAALAEQEQETDQ